MFVVCSEIPDADISTMELGIAGGIGMCAGVVGAGGSCTVTGVASSSRDDARTWVRLYVRAAFEAGPRGLAACFPIGREQLCAEDAKNAERLAEEPDFHLALGSDGKSAVLTWTADGTSERYPLSPHHLVDDEGKA